MRIDRREFLGAAVGAAGLLVSDAKAAAPDETPAAKPNPFLDSLRSFRLGFGTGMKGWKRESNQTRLGEKEFNKLLLYAYDSGIRLFDMADLYGTHGHVARALKGKPRDSYFLTSKIWFRPDGLPEPERHDADVYVRRFLKELDTDYIDLLHIHCQTEGDWPKQMRKQMDLLDDLKRKGMIRGHGASIHSLEALEAAAGEPWVDAVNARVNQYRQRTDGPMEKVVPILKRIHAAGKGVIAMKLNGEGTLDERQREAAMRFVSGLDCVDAMIVGFEKTAEIDYFLSVVRPAAESTG
ncbi:MAG: aldo/keto reductase [Pirellulaceae bacterium]|nr:aldo/keto reductase [Pirellulaceae bacterium]